ncbi:MAG TPA: hypothetical protein VFQ53_10645 [Kofleriaceae bacterium]|nr:hypothetical protein [Kofleriaceae bacterium]
MLGELRYENLAGLLAAQVRITRDPDQSMRIATQQGGEVRGGLTRQGGDPHARGVQPTQIQAALRGDLEQPLGAPPGIDLVGGTDRDLGGREHRGTIP